MMKIISRKCMLSEIPTSHSSSEKHPITNSEIETRGHQSDALLPHPQRNVSKVGFEGTRAQGEGLATLLMRKKPIL